MNVDSKPHVAIVVLNFNGLDDTRICLETLANSTWENSTVIVVDNASDVDPTPILNDEFPWCVVIRNDVNGGWAGGNNVGMRRARELDCDHVILLNNDTTVSPQMVERLVTAACQRKEFGIIGPIINHMERPDEVQTDGCLFNRDLDGGFFDRLSIPLETLDTPNVTEVDIVNGCCMMISKPVIDQIGYIDERFFLIHEESDYCLRATESGFKCGVISESHVWHKQSVSFYRAGKRIQCYYDVRNVQLLLRKHLGSHEGGRSRLASWVNYLRMFYYRYCIEREHDQVDSARAVLEGFYDGLIRRYGPWKQRSRIMVTLLLPPLESFRRLLNLIRSRKATAAKPSPSQ